METNVQVIQMNIHQIRSRGRNIICSTRIYNNDCG